MTPADKAECTKQNSAFKENGLIRKSQSPFAAPLLFVSKSPFHDGSNGL
jgi:hypothetical protein